MKLVNSKNANKATYGDGMRACFSMDNFDRSTKKWKSAVGGFEAQPTNPASISVKSDSVGTNGVIEHDVEYVSGTTSA